MPMCDINFACCLTCAARSHHLLDWEFSGLGDSVFNYRARFFHCPQCGLVSIGNIDDETLGRFYATECDYAEKAHFSVESPANQEKFAYYTRLLHEYGISGGEMADVGCGRGGFVNWLVREGWQGGCCGVDVDAKSLPLDDSGAVNLRFLDGGALTLPFADGALTLLTYFHVFEHIHNLDSVTAEAARTVRQGGHLMIEVPDAERYAKHPVGSAFWISIREHVHHFTAKALDAVLSAHGFTLVALERAILPTPEFDYPSLVVIAMKGDAVAVEPPSPANVASFVTSSYQALTDQARRLAALPGPVTFWGCSAEFFSLLPLVEREDIRLCDASGLKQAARYRGRPIADPAMLPVEGTLVVAPYLHDAAIRQAALQLGWPKAAIYSLQ